MHRKFSPWEFINTAETPRYAGGFIALTGISIIGRSLLAFLLTVTLIVRIGLYNLTLGKSCLEEYLKKGY
ncbi:hypothetical protein [Thermococcus litoralis]|uniref:hypothetical protein n=1 Tax=Thermococcus litoralis TaxID=2265 RepID=UPI0011815C48|nr:hypothetical protein [Thermococcus litoralis]